MKAMTAESRLVLSNKEWEAALDAWLEESRSWRGWAEMARERPEDFRMARWARVLATTMRNEPRFLDDACTSSGLLWWEFPWLASHGTHPGLASLGAERARTQLIELLVAACSGFSPREPDTQGMLEVLRALERLVVVALGSEPPCIKDQPLDQAFVEQALEHSEASRDHGVSLARELWKRVTCTSGRLCDPTFSRFRRKDGNAPKPWSRERLAAFTRAAASDSSGLSRLGSNSVFVNAALAVPGIVLSEGLIESLERQYALLHTVYCGELSEAAASLLAARNEPSSAPALSLAQRAFFERFLYAPSLVDRGPMPVGSALFEPSTGTDADALTSRALNQTSFFFSWSLLPGVGELEAGAPLAWHTVLVFVNRAAHMARRKHLALAQGLGRIIALQWPTWTDGFDPDAASDACLAPITEALARGDHEAATRAAFRNAGLTYKRPGRITRRRRGTQTAARRTHSAANASTISPVFNTLDS